MNKKIFSLFLALSFLTNTFGAEKGRKSFRKVEMVEDTLSVGRKGSISMSYRYKKNGSGLALVKYKQGDREVITTRKIVRDGCGYKDSSYLGGSSFVSIFRGKGITPRIIVKGEHDKEGRTPSPFEFLYGKDLPALAPVLATACTLHSSRHHSRKASPRCPRHHYGRMKLSSNGSRLKHSSQSASSLLDTRPKTAPSETMPIAPHPRSFKTPPPKAGADPSEEID